LVREEKAMIKKYGAYALLAGLVIAVLVGVFPQLESDWITVALVILGLIGGVLNVSNEKTADFLMAGVALMLAAQVRSEIANVASRSIANVIKHVLENIAIVTACATLVLAIKTIVAAAREKQA
jgi:hypothetical protein